MSKHTEGPWTHQEFDLHEKRLSVYGPDGAIAFIQSDDIDSDEARANLSLIAAAPELLDALKAVLDFEAGRIPLSALVEIASRNIAKAEGKS